MGLSFLPIEKLFVFDKHVVVDARDNSIHLRDEHYAKDALMKCIDDNYAAEIRRKPELEARVRFDAMNYAIQRQFGGMGVDHAVGEVPEGFFNEDDIPEDYITFGPFYTYEGCLHSKNMVASIIWMRDHLMKIDSEERDLTEGEQRVAAEFNTYLQICEGKASYSHEHDADGEEDSPEEDS